MEGRFGAKDAVVLLVLGAIAVGVWLSMVQRDREWDQVMAVRSKLADLERQLVRMEERFASAPVRPADAGAGSAGGARGAGTTAGAGEAATRDASWARPGVPVEWQPPRAFTTNPSDHAAFQTGGEFRELFESQPAKVTPYVQTDVYGRRAVDLVVEALGTYDPQALTFRGLLAEAWQVDPAGLWMRVRIRPEARFSDGAPVTAEDVRWTWHDFVMNPQIEAARMRNLYGDVIREVGVLDARTVEFRFAEPFFTNTIAALTLFVLPSHFYGQFTPSQLNASTGLLMGSGPFKMSSVDPEWAPPQPIVLVRNEQYWGPRPPLASIRFRTVADELPRLTEYRNGRADMITPQAAQFVASTSDPAWQASNQSLNWTNMRSARSAIIWNCGNRDGRPTPFTDPRVRLAMTHLLDREKMIRDIWAGIGIVAKGYANPGTPGENTAISPWPYDPSRARELLREAGWEDRNGDRVLEDASGTEFTFEMTNFGGGEVAERISTFVKDACAAQGIRVSVRTLDWAVGDVTRKQRDFDAMLMSWAANDPESDPRQIFHSASIEDQGDNFAQWANADADRVIDAARRELDPAKRAALWHEFERILHEQQPYTWVRVVPWLRFVKPEIGNVRTYPKGIEYWEFFRASEALPMAVN